MTITNTELMTITNAELKFFLIVAAVIGWTVDTYILFKYGTEVMKDIRMIWPVIPTAFLFITVED